MTTGPLISVIIPFLNLERFLAEAVESVLAQSFQDWELILVDDGSSDGSTEIAKRYAERHPGRIRRVEHPGHANLGISASRNLGRRHARGRWIASLDGDDVWLAGKLAEQMEILSRHPEVGLVIGASRYWHGWTGRAEDAAKDRVVAIGAPPDKVYAPPHLLELLYPLAGGAAPSMNTVLVRADVVDRVGGWENSFRVAYEDQAFLTKIYLATPVYVSAACWDLYRQRPGSSMQVDLTGASYNLHRSRFLHWFEEYLRGRELTGTPVWRLTRRALRPYRYPWMSRVERIGRRAIGQLLGAGAPS
ncbi:glycosyltransferase family 2 protein [Indioceanicola profundi]|uniref:glycosyltransferase family 2 protein n=1 Tax=Indioceanicola profundi TaxID=2220096 RepID=UPI000E6AA4C3|nr:glycosyltransferase family 2 protein [Indioceanicola profundi]